ncbi:N-acetylmuramoyl-L-alanine amidase family protein [Prolixibacter denitrificans]|uniref:N-acetylmuramoyl-L-alanine amidase n=1 Tax=Prolixibacter denitrificans TaxID=1541063 RepID=A0A2P8CCV0_9BACT|nr:N-acetylmuramoyl-L-alanine amidase [Prolixibacter denitrificans]PSK82797.1 N-acetylmuramoyl-L-alanine amidase [Prolixibacter denitrificans]GET21388.1 N-acetylmuramoyl-L-alanine amidase [Prolixibacter denitrificans]
MHKKIPESPSILIRITIHTIFILFWFGNSFAQNSDHPEVKARRGDGIYNLLERNGLPAGEYLNKFIELNKSKLGPNNTLYEGRSYLLPVATLFAEEPLFGKEHEKVRIQDRKLEGAIFYLVSGHGGPDPGAMGKIGKHRLTEDEYAYDVTLRLGRALIQHGAKVYFIIRDPKDGIRDEYYLENRSDEYCYPHQKIPLDQNQRLRQRAAAVNELYKRDPSSKYKRCIIIHVDARNRHRNIDLFFYHFEKSKSGEQLAEAMRHSMKVNYKENQPNRGYNGTVSSRRLYMLTRTNPTAVYIEMGNINHTRDQQRLIYPDNRQALADWLTEGIVKDYQSRQ